MLKQNCTYEEALDRVTADFNKHFLTGLVVGKEVTRSSKSQRRVCTAATFLPEATT